jgi:hypothetical protein
LQGEVFVFRELWQVVKRQRGRAETEPTGSFYDHLVALVFAFHTLEGYINFIGERLEPNLWAKERRAFRSVMDKFYKILELVSLSPDLPARPFSSVNWLKGFRDVIAHAKTERFARILEETGPILPSLYVEPFGNFVTPDQTSIICDDIKAVIETIHAAALPYLTDTRYLTTGALDGVMQHGTGSTIADS